MHLSFSKPESLIYILYGLSQRAKQAEFPSLILYLPQAQESVLCRWVLLASIPAKTGMAGAKGEIKEVRRYRELLGEEGTMKRELTFY